MRFENPKCVKMRLRCWGEKGVGNGKGEKGKGREVGKKKGLVQLGGRLLPDASPEFSIPFCPNFYNT